MTSKPLSRSVRTMALLACVALCLAGCPQPSGPPLVRSRLPIHVGSTAFPGQPDGTGGTNKPYVAVTVCVPNSNPQSCQTIDNIMIDTGSVGLRLFSQVVSVALPPAPGPPTFECEGFGAGYAWGQVVLASLTLAQEPPVTVPIQLITPAPLPSGTPACNFNRDVLTPSGAGFNGILGLAPFANDTLSTKLSSDYLTCTASGCTCAAGTAACAGANGNPTLVPNPIFQVPVASNATKADSNGVIIDLSGVSGNGNGATGVVGSLFLGIGTNSPWNDPTYLTVENNLTLTNKCPHPNCQTPITTIVGTNYIVQTVFNGAQYSGPVDTGSNAYYFPDGSLPVCSAPQNFYYCLATPTILSATVLSSSGSSSAVQFWVANGSTLINSRNSAFSNLGGSFGPLFFDWGLPFFYDRFVYIVYASAIGNDGTISIQWQPPLWAYSFCPNDHCP